MKLLLYLSGLLAALSLIALAGGCGPLQPATIPAQKAAGDLSAVDSDFAQVGADLSTILPLVPAAVHPVIIAGQKSIKDGQAANADARAQLARLAAHDAAMTAKVNEYDGAFLGGRGNRWKWGILIGMGVLGVLGIAAMASGTIATGGVGSGLFVGALMGIGHFCLSWVPVVGHWIAAGFAEVFRRRSVQQATGAVLQSVGVAANHAGQPVVAMPATAVSVAAIAAPAPLGAPGAK